MDRDTLEHQLFAWENWDEVNTGDLQFYDVTLVSQVGEYPVGTKFPAAFFLNSQSLLVLVDDKNQEHAYPIVITLGPKVEPHSQADACDCGHDHS